MDVDLLSEADSLDFGQRMDRIKTVGPKDAIMTKKNLKGIREKWQRFCAAERKGDWYEFLKLQCTRGTFKHFLKYILDHYRLRKGKKPKQSSVHEYWRQFMMMFKRATGARVDANDAEDVLQFLYGPLTVMYALDATIAPKPVLGIADVLTLLEFHWAVDESVYADERQRVQVPTALLFAEYTGARPAELVDGELPEGTRTMLETWTVGPEEPVDWEKEFGFSAPLQTERRCKALCYEDVTLMLVRDPDHGGRTTLGMEVLLANHKGMDNHPKPVYFPILLDDDPIFCLITHFVALAVSDNAFKNPHITSAESLFDFQVEGPVQCTPLEWKPEMLKVPVFRHPIQTRSGPRTSSHKPLTAQQYGFYLSRLGCAAGFKERLNWYCNRRSTANALIEGAPVPIREQVLRHKHGSSVIQAYLNRRTNFDIQALVRNRPARKGLLNSFAHMGLHRDPRAPERMPDNIFNSLPPDPVLVRLQQDKDRLKRRIRSKSTIAAQRKAGSELVKRYDKLIAEINTARVQRRKEADEQYRNDYFQNRPSQDIERQAKGIKAPEYVKPVIEHQIEDRNQLLHIFSDKRENLSFGQITRRQRRAAGLLEQLCRRREVRRHRRRANVPRRHSRHVKVHQAVKLEDAPVIKIESPPPARLESFPLLLEKTQCPMCVGDESLPSYQQRAFCYSRPSKMMDHVERSHLQHIKSDEQVPCMHPKCKAAGIVLRHVMHYKNHVATVHGIALRP